MRTITLVFFTVLISKKILTDHNITAYLVLLAEILRLSPTVLAQGMVVKNTSTLDQKPVLVHV